MYLGSLVAFLFSAVVGDIFSSRTLIIAGLVVNIGALLVVILVDSFWVGVVALFF